MKLALALLALLSLWARAATACDDMHSHTSVLGVAPDGSFVTHRWVSGGVTCALERLELRAPDALLVASYDNDPDTEQGCLARWTVTGSVPLPEHFKAAARAAETALALAPELIPARTLLLRSLALAGTPWSLAEGRVTGFYRDVRECREGNFYDYMSVVEEPIFDAWHEDESFEAWISDEFGRHIAAHGSDEVYSGNWDRP